MLACIMFAPSSTLFLMVQKATANVKLSPTLLLPAGFRQLPYRVLDARATSTDLACEKALLFTWMARFPGVQVCATHCSKASPELQYACTAPSAHIKSFKQIDQQ